jgi:copper resistance protein C
MKRRNFAVLATGVAILAMLLTVGVASAHAPIKFITWDAPSNPTTLTASTDNLKMATTPNSFYLRVYNAGGSRVDKGDAKVSADQTSITVTLVPGLQPGPYRVDWKTTSTDGAVLSSSVAVMLPAANGGEVAQPADDDEEEAAPVETAPAEVAPIAPPSTGDGGLADRRGGSDTSAALAAGVIALMAAGGGAFAYGKKR